MSKYNNYYSRAKNTYSTAKKSYKKTASFASRVKENYDIVLITLGAVVVASFFGFTLTSKTVTTEITNP